VTADGLTPDALLDWADAYQRAWRSPGSAGTDLLSTLFAPDATHLTDPYADPQVGLEAIAAFWAEESEPDELFTMTAEAVACSGRTGVLRVLVRYGEPVTQEYLDLWVVTIGSDGLASRFEEWPFWPTHGRSPVRPPAVVVHAPDVATEPYEEWVRSATLSSGVYRLPAGSTDGQSPHLEDEVYVVTAGVLDIDGERTPVRPSSLAYVPRRVPHRFLDITEDLEVAVVFAPPESST